MEKLDAVHGLETQLQAAAANPSSDASSFAGTFLGNTLYLDYVQYQSEKKGLVRQKEELEKMRDQEREKLNGIPEKAAAFAQLSMRRQSLQTARNLLYSRLREATLFDENAPGYYIVFAPASVDRVVKHGRAGRRRLIFTAAGGIFCFCMALLLALGLEFTDSTLRTPAARPRAPSMPRCWPPSKRAGRMPTAEPPSGRGGSAANPNSGMPARSLVALARAGGGCLLGLALRARRAPPAGLAGHRLRPAAAAPLPTDRP